MLISFKVYSALSPGTAEFVGKTKISLRMKLGSTCYHTCLLFGIIGYEISKCHFIYGTSKRNSKIFSIQGRNWRGKNATNLIKIIVTFGDKTLILHYVQYMNRIFHYFFHRYNFPSVHIR